MDEALKKRIRGWFPQESTPRIIPAKICNKTDRQPKIAFIAIFFAVFATVFLSLYATNAFGLGGSAANFAAIVAAFVSAVAVSIMYRVPSKNKPLTAEGKNTVKTIAGVNAGMACVLLGIYFLVNPNISTELALELWIVLLSSMFAVNSLLVRRLKKQMAQL